MFPSDRTSEDDFHLVVENPSEPHRLREDDSGGQGDEDLPEGGPVVLVGPDGVSRFGHGSGPV